MVMTAGPMAERTTVATRVAEVLAALSLPRSPRGTLGEFGPRYAAARQMAIRYGAAVAVVGDHPEGRARLTEHWPAIRGQLDRIGGMCEQGIGRQPPHRRSRRKRRDRYDPKARQRSLHAVHQALVRLERMVDAAVAMSIAVVLAGIDPASARRRAEVDDWVRALTDALRELEQGQLDDDSTDDDSTDDDGVGDDATGGDGVGDDEAGEHRVGNAVTG
jgi:hypothetical protein